MSNPYTTPAAPDRGYVPQLGRPVASVGKRIGGRLIDGIIVGVVVGLALVPWLAKKIDSVAEGESVSTGALFAAGLAALAVSFLYEVPMTAARGQTLGKRIVGTKVVRLADGQLPGWNTAVMRWLPALVGIVPRPIGSLLGAVVGIGSLILLFTDPLRQTVYDKVGKTVVVDA